MKVHDVAVEQFDASANNSRQRALCFWIVQPLSIRVSGCCILCDVISLHSVEVF